MNLLQKIRLMYLTAVQSTIKQRFTGTVNHINSYWYVIPISVCCLIHIIAISAMSIDFTILQIIFLALSFAPLFLIPHFIFFSCWAILTIWCIGIFPSTTTPLPNSYFITCLLAIGILGYKQLRQGIPAAIVIGIISFLSQEITIGNNANSSSISHIQANYFLTDLLFPTSLLLLAAIVGHTMQQEHNREQLRHKLREIENEKAITRNLHDHIANDITDAILIIRHLQTADEENINPHIEDAIVPLEQANSRIHELIRHLEAKHTENHESSPAMLSIRDDVYPFPTKASNNININLQEQLQDIFAQQQRRLTDMGFEGIALLPETLFHDDTEAIGTLLTGFVREIFSNIANHANPDCGYVVTVEATPSQYAVRVTDVPQTQSLPSIAHSHNGLTYYRSAITQIQGSLNISHSDGYWSMEALIPRE